MFPADGIKIISGTLHSHHAGRKMTLRHVRDGKELERIIEDDNYDYNFQQVRQLEQEVVVMPGDYIITDCAYEVSTTTARLLVKCADYTDRQTNCIIYYRFTRISPPPDIESQTTDIRWLLNQTGDVSVLYHLLSTHWVGWLL